jgi:glutathione-regulated potassium-efflux system protein KefB
MDLTDFYEALKSQATPVDEKDDIVTDAKK